MTTIQEIKAILDDIKKDLASKATSDKIEELVKLLKEKDTKIDSLEQKIEILESKVAIVMNTNELLTRKVDDGEQYQRRLSLRVSGIPCDENEKETGEVCLRKVKEEVTKLGLNPNDLRFDRAHRIGPVRKNNEGKELPRQMIFRMTSWADRTAIYRSRQKGKDVKVRFYIDLTKRRFELKKLAIERIQGHPLVDFCFVDVNCNLCIRFSNGTYKYFNSTDELETILS